MACEYCHGTGWVCERHPAQPFGHTGCGAAGMPCADYRCVNPKNPPPLPPGWNSLANVTASARQGLQRVPWNGTPCRLARCWRVTKDGRVATCELWNHPFGWELRAEAEGELVRSQVFREAEALVVSAVEWRAAFSAKGWS